MVFPVEFALFWCLRKKLNGVDTRSSEKNGQDSGLDGNELLCYRKRQGLPKSQETQPLEGTAFVWQRNVFQRG